MKGIPVGITYFVDHARRRISARGEGPLSFEAICAYTDAGRRARVAGYDEIFDATAAVPDVTAEQVRQLVVRVHQTAPLRTWGATAIVATQPFVFGLARMYGILCEAVGAHVEVFRTFAEAERWLDSRPNNPPVT
jgi:hypothetical protein